MAILINNDTGLAENLSLEAQQAAINQGTHSVPLVDVEGQSVTAPFQDASALVQQGYRQPNSQELTKLNEYAKYSTTSEQLKTGLESAASAATFGISRGVEAALLGNQEEQLARQEVNPISAGVGEAAGIAGSLATGYGAPSAISKLGAKVAPVVAESVVARLGSVAVREAVENAVFQAGNEVGQMLISNPEQTIGTAASNIGLAGLIGAGFGVGMQGTAELWKLGPGKAVEATLDAIKNRSAGLPVELKSASKLEIPAEIEAALSDNESAKKMALQLMDSDSNAGINYQKVVHEFDQNAKNATAQVFQKTNADIANLSEESLFSSGKKIKDDLIKDLKTELKPISEKYDNLAKSFEKATLQDADKAMAAENIAKLISDEGLAKMPNSSANAFANKVLKDLPLQETAQDLRNYVKNLRNEAPFGSEVYDISKKLSKVLDVQRDISIERALAEKGPELLQEFKLNQQAYKNMLGNAESLNERLHLGKIRGPKSFIEAIEGMDPETLVKRMSPKGDVQMQELLQNKYPSVLEEVKKNELNRLLKASKDKSGDALDIKKLYNNLQNPDKFSPELRDFLLSPQQQQQLSALKDLIDRMPTRKSAFQRAADTKRIWEEIPASAMAMVSGVLGHNPAIGYVVGKLSHYMNVEAPDAIKLSMLKYLASDKPVSSEGFAAFTKLAQETIKGEHKINKAVSGLFKAGRMTLIDPDVKSNEKLKKDVQTFIDNPQKMLDIASGLSHYGEGQQGAMAATTARVVQYLAQLKPKTQQLGVLNKPIEPTKAQESDFNRAVEIANNPASILNRVKDGSLIAKDLMHLKAMYPDMHARLASKIQTELINAKEAEVSIPNSLRTTLSLFLAQPMDSSLMPQAIMSAQGHMQMPPPQMPKSSAQLSKLPNMYQTQGQAREASRLK